MPPTLQTVVRRMGLRPLAGGLPPDTVVRWVAVSELADPTPYLEGDELLLTTGLRLEGDLAGYVGRLVARGVAGLGFGVGVSHTEVPAALVEAASRAGLPLLEVPRETPFIAIGKAVSELLAAEQYEEITWAFAAQGRLTRAALRPEGMYAVVDRLAKEVGGWAALLDETGAVRHATRGARTDGVTAELGRLLTGHGRPSPAGPGEERPGEGGRWRWPASLALSGPGEHVVVQPLGGGRARPRGFFAVGAKEAFSPVTHTVINAAGSLLTLSMEQGRAQAAAERRVRSAALDLLLSGAGQQARDVLAALGGRLPEPPLAVLATRADALDALEGRAFAAPEPHAEPGAGEVAFALVPEAEVAAAAREADAPVGVSLPATYEPASLATAIDQARRALAAALTSPGPVPVRVVRFGELAGQGLLGLLDQPTAQAFATALLAPLTAYGSRADLVESLRAYLESNGHWDAAAQRLGIHRHTLRYRMRRVGELLDRDLDDPGVRAELWLALEAARRYPATSSAPGSSR
ncbi:Purine catabolism regulatory protein-like family protein [Nonomuraea coxensis DSM 45129]|uniref:Purine catabolism regulatory protein-like family protein n=1 Tax=Nonomuraea coxensis DSM 45129 TaxID=1122611 RepID=A0ABX8TY61_9ACTN|nr:PucR family transcriptional regulator [Nonomuraea coxensis]QYC39479.1 Purine catabolism regulatory protein-like family protein [Nonomuraea coxensis DSM 45129]